MKDIFIRIITFEEENLKFRRKEGAFKWFRVNYEIFQEHWLGGVPPFSKYAYTVLLAHCSLQNKATIEFKLDELALASGMDPDTLFLFLIILSDRKIIQFFEKKSDGSLERISHDALLKLDDTLCAHASQPVNNIMEFSTEGINNASDLILDLNTKTDKQTRSKLSDLKEEHEACLTDRQDTVYSKNGACQVKSTDTLCHFKKNDPHLEFSELLNLWNEYCGELPKVEKISDKRIKHMKNRLMHEPNLDYWKEVILRLSNSSFCLGNNSSGWRASFDFLLQPDTHIKVMEGKYDNRDARPDFRLAKSIPKEVALAQTVEEMKLRIERGEL